MASLEVTKAAERVRAALHKKFQPTVDSRVAARVGNNLVAINGQFVPGNIDADAAAVVNTGRPSAAQYSAANGGTVVISSTGAGSVVGGGGDSGVRAFSDLSGIIGDIQAPQFLKTDGTRMLIGDLLVAPGVRIDDVDISVHAADPDAHHPRGNNGDATIIANVDDQLFSVNQAHGFTWTAQHTNSVGLITPHLGAPNAMLLDSVGDMTIHAGDGMGITATGNMVITPGVDLTLNPGGDLTIDPGGIVYFPVAQTLRTPGFHSSFPIGGWNIGQTAITGQSGLTIGAIAADELRVRVFVADETRVDRGERYESKSFGILSADFTTPSSLGGTVRIYFEDSPAISGAIFSNTDWLLFGVIDIGTGLTVAKIWGQVSSYTNETGDFQSWLFTLRQGPTDYEIKKGRLAVDWGQSGQAIIHYSALDITGAPYIEMFKWVGSDPYTPANYILLARMGDMGGISDSVLDPTGHGIYTGNAYLNGDLVTAGGAVRLYRGDGINIQADVLQTGDATMILQWWQDIEARGGTPIASLSVYEQQIGTQPDSDWIELIANPIGTVGANVYIAAQDLGGGSYASVRVSGASTYNPFSEILIDAHDITLAGTDVYIGAILHTGSIVNGIASTYDIGSSSNPYRTLYVDTVIAGTIGSSVPLTGQTWQYDPGDMFIKSSSGSLHTLYISNPGAGLMNLDVDGSIVVGGTVDGIDISAHAANVNAHHLQSHILATTSALGGDHTVSGLTTGMVLKATSGTAAQFIQLQFSELGGIPSVIAGTGMTGGGALTSSVTLTLGTPSDITVSTSNGVSGTTHTHAVVSSSNPGSNARLLASTSGGALTLQSLTLAGTGTVLTSTAGTLSMGDNTDVVARLGQTRIGYNGTADYASFGHRDIFDATNYGLSQSSIGNTYLNASTGEMIYHRINNADVLMMNVDRLLPAGSNLKSLGDYNRKFSELNVVQLMVDNLVASNVMATIGGRIMVAPTAKLTRDIIGSATTIYIDSNLAQPLNELYMAGLDGITPRTEWMRIISGPVNTGTDEWSYVITRNIKEQGNLLGGINYGFETGNTTNWTTFVDTGASLTSFTVDGTSQARGTYSGKVLVGSNGGAHYAGIYTTVTLTAGVTYSVSFYARLSGINGFQADTTGPGGLDTSQANIVGTVGWTRYSYEFDAISTGTHQIRFYENSPAAGSFWIDEVIVEAKFGTNGYAWYIGDANVNLGYATGSGYIDLTSLTTIAGHYGPTIAVYAHRTDGGQPKATTALGNLRSYVDYTADTMGWAVGNDLTLTPTSGFTGMTGDAVSGLRLFNVEQRMYSGGAEFLRLDTARGISLMSYLSSGAIPAINGITFYRDSLGGNKAGYLASVYDTFSVGNMGNITYLSAYDSTVGPGRISAFVFDEGGGASAGLTVTGAKPTLSKVSTVSIGGTVGSVSGAYASWGVGNNAGSFGTAVYDAATGNLNTSLSSGIIFTKAFGNFSSATRSEVSNDLGTYQSLMLLGNSAAGGDHRVSVYDRLNINGAASWIMQLNINGGIFLTNMSTPGTPSGGGYLYANAGKLFWKGTSGTNTQVAPA